MRKLLIWHLNLILSVLLSFLLFVTPALAITGFGKDSDETKKAFAEYYGWNFDNIDKATWIGLDNFEYSRPHSHQKETFEDLFEAVEKHCIELGISISSGGSGGGSGGYNIAAVARAEVDKPDCMEVPDGSNNVKYNTWRYGHPVSGDNYMWCANFVAWCANECGLVESGLFNKAESVRGVYEYQTQTNGFDAYVGTQIEQLGGSGYRAVPGDIFCFGYSHIGIVTAITDSSIEITQGNTRNTVLAISYDRSSLSDSSVGSGYIIHVNYPQDDNTMLYFFTTQMGLNEAAAAGICANIEHESNFNPNALGDSGTSYGICQWHNERWDNLKRFCDTNNYDWHSMDGQLWFLKHELETSYPSVMNTLRSVPNTAGGAYDAAYKWCTDFEVPQYKEAKAVQRGNSARDTYFPKFFHG